MSECEGRLVCVCVWGGGVCRVCGWVLGVAWIGGGSMCVGVGGWVRSVCVQVGGIGGSVGQFVLGDGWVSGLGGW